MLRLWSILGFVILLLLANWPYEYQEVLNQPLGNGAQLFSAFVMSSEHEIPTLAGWPCKFYLSVPDEGDPSLVCVRWFPLLIDMCFWALVPISFVIYERFLFNRVKRSDALLIEEASVFDNAGDVPRKKRRPRSSKYDRKSKRRSVQLADIFVFTALIASVFGYWQLLRARGELDKKFASEIAKSGGGAVRAAMLPWIARDLLRIGGHAVCLRISEVRLSNPDDQLLSKVVALPYLRTLNITGGEYDMRILDRLATNPLFSELAVVGRPLNEDAIAAIRSIQSLRKLNLMRTNITAAGVAALELPRLRELNLVHTDVRLSELGTPAFSNTIRKLTLPHPAKGASDSLSLDGWPELTELACYEYDELLNSEPVAIKLKNLPSLYKIELDGLQKFDIDLEQLPSLAKLEPSFLQWNQRTSPNEIVPDFVWAGKLRVKNVPNLGALTIFAADSQAITLDDGPLQIALSVYNKGNFRAAPSNAKLYYQLPGYLSDEDIPLIVRQKWIDDLATCQGIERITLEYVPLDDVNLKSLVENQSVRVLVFDHCGLVISQLSELQGMDQLQEISLMGANVDGATVERLIKWFPNLRKIRCEQTFIEQLQLENVPNLESLFDVPEGYDPYRYSSFMYKNQKKMSALRIVNAPVYRDQLVVKWPLKILHIESAPSLAGLSFHEPLPSSAVIKGVEHLKFFAAGGPTCTDAIVSEVMCCKELQRLTLAYTNLSPATFQKISELRELKYLELTGSKIINDEIVTTFAALNELKTLRLGHTAITSASVQTITKLRDLEVLDLEGTQLSSKDVSLLVANLSKLQDISLAGAELTAENMRQISKLYSVLSLDLSGCRLSDELIDAFLETPPSLLIDLKLNSATISAAGFSKLVSGLRSTRFAVRNTKLSLNLLDPLIARGRIAEHDDDGGPINGRRAKPSFNFSVNGQEMDLPQESDLDPDKFKPKEKDPLE